MHSEKTKNYSKCIGVDYEELEYKELQEEGSLKRSMGRLWRPVEDVSKGTLGKQEERK